ncbi:MAG: peptidoglycan glycosyltransferase [Flavobacteriales bacterium]|nr:peptidoglycan glycosyltransferase [Flavobacteriales bacterium]
MDPYQNRRWVIILSIIAVSIVMVVRLLYLQVLDDKWADRSEEITHSEKSLKPSRGLIYDRNGVLLVEASQVYDIYVTPDKIGETDTTELCKIFDLTREEFDKKLEKASNYASYKASIFIEGMHKDDYAKISYILPELDGFYEERNTQRGYPEHIAAHVLGYIGIISKEEYDADRNSEEPYYTMNDYIGKSGIELVYEKELRGKRGKVSYLKDRLGNEKEDLYSRSAKAGENLYTTLDVELQKYGELLMHNKVGCIVAIEPSTGEILSMVSAPFYDPELFVGRDFGKKYAKINQEDSLGLKPLINKGIYNDTYRPGSIFKLVQALVGMEEGVIQHNTAFACNKALIGCHNHPSPTSVSIAIQHSCNPYFYQVFKKLIQRGDDPSIFKDSRLGIEKWAAAVKSFGLGVKLETDIPGVKSGLIPDANFYDNEFPSKDKPYGKHSWAFSTIYSNSIGEGEIGVSPLQMANLAAIIANRGFYYTPHLVRKVGENGEKRDIYQKRNYTVVSPEHFEPVVNAMEQVVLNGTAKRAQIEGISVCGKTGTVENKAENINDHSVFIAFAPKDDPKIAVAVYVEYGTWGGTWAAPIASLMIERYLNGQLSEKGKAKEDRVTSTSILYKNQKFK